MQHPDAVSTIHWRSAAQRPEDASYVLIKITEPDGDIFCIPGAYEDGLFLDVLSLHAAPIPEARILGWSYYPYDERLEKH